MPIELVGHSIGGKIIECLVNRRRLGRKVDLVSIGMLSSPIVENELDF